MNTKRKITLFTIFIFLTFSILTYSQSKDSLKSKRVIIAISLFDVFPNNLNAASFNLGTEIYLKNRKSIGLNVGYIKSFEPTGGYFQLSTLSTKGIKLQVEGKQYLNKRKIFIPALFIFWPHIFQFKTQELQNTGYYVAANFSYQNTKTDRAETVVDYIDDIPYPNHTHYKANVYTVDRNAYALNIKFGYNCIKKCGFTLDHVIGLGVQYVSSSSKNRLGTDASWPNSERELYAKKLFDHGAAISPSLIYQLKLGWAF